MKKIMIKARDGVHLACHQFSSSNPGARVICLHGGSLNSRRYIPLAKVCQQAGYEMVLCEWRGHGDSEGARGTCSYPGQLEEDLNDIIDWFNQHDSLPIIIGGHSAGAIISMRYLEKYGQDKVAGCFFISPALGNSIEALRFDAPSSKIKFLLGFWRKKPTYTPVPQAALRHTPKINNSLFWLAYLIPFLRHRAVLKFPAVEKMAKMEGRVLEYSFNLMMAVSISNYIKIFRQLEVPTILICGEDDELFHPDLLPTISQWHLAPELDKEVHMLPKVNHMSVISASRSILVKWLQKRWKVAGESEIE